MKRTMKRSYEKPFIRVVELESEPMLTGSGGDNHGGGPGETEPTQPSRGAKGSWFDED